MTIFVIWQLIVTLDSIRNSCDVYSLFVSPPILVGCTWLRLKIQIDLSIQCRPRLLNQIDSFWWDATLQILRCSFWGQIVGGGFRFWSTFMSNKLYFIQHFLHTSYNQLQKGMDTGRGLWLKTTRQSSQIYVEDICTQNTFSRNMFHLIYILFFTDL